MKKKSQILFLLFFAVILILPISLSGLRAFTGKSFDVPLSGYTDSTPGPSLSLQSVASGTFQEQASARIEEKMPLRGVCIKNYNTLQYYAFHLGNLPIGKEASVFQVPYLEEYLSIGSQYDFSRPENPAKLEGTVAHMVSVNQKLEALGKHLFVYLVPGKAELYPEQIPDNYLAIGNADSLSALERMTALLKDTEIPCLFCEELADELEYPAFYSTGIHWSRTFEQKVSQQLLSEFSELTGKSYPNIEFTGVEESTAPFCRDADVYDVLNLWTPPKGVYYQYKTESAIPQEEDPLRITLWGDSFGEGFRSDLAKESLSNANIIYINRDDYVFMSSEAAQIPLEDDWTNLDWQFCLDFSDLIIVELAAPEIVCDTFGFIQALDAYLDRYTPRAPASYYKDKWDACDPATDSLRFSSGLWGREDGFSWTMKQAHVMLSSESIAQNGFEISYAVRPQSIHPDRGDTVTISVNDTVISNKTYWQETEDTLIFPAETMPEAKDGIYYITITCSDTFNPKEMGLSEDERDLGIQLMYAGGAR